MIWVWRAPDVPHPSTSKRTLIHEAVATTPGLELPTNPAIPKDDSDFIEDGTYHFVDDGTHWDDGTWNDRAAREHFGTVPDDVREHVQSVLARHRLTVSTYKRNAGAPILALSFIDDGQSNLLLRIYVHSGKLFEDELARLLDLFHDWLGTLKNQTVRQGGYKTPSGRVIEFCGEPGTTPVGMERELKEFARFLSVLDEPAKSRANT